MVQEEILIIWFLESKIGLAANQADQVWSEPGVDFQIWC